jgi:hypothetical protein
VVKGREATMASAPFDVKKSLSTFLRSLENRAIHAWQSDIREISLEAM